MPTKKPAAVRKAAATPSKSRKTAPAPAPAVAPASSARRMWALPIAMLMLVVAAGGLWLAVRESSNAPQAATPSVAHTAVAPVPPAHNAESNAAAPARSPSTEVTPPTPVATAKPVTVTGCLQQAGDGFVLKNAEGSAVSKTRSWKSGFLKRSAPPIDVVDAGGAAHLGLHVGQRVAVSGPLAGGELRVQSLHRVAASCQ